MATSKFHPHTGIARGRVMGRHGEDNGQQGKLSTQEPITDLATVDSLDFLRSIAETTKDDELVDDALQIITRTATLRVILQRLSTRALVSDELLDLPRRERTEVRQTRDFLEECQERIDDLHAELRVAGETAHTAMSEIRDARDHESGQTRKVLAEKRSRMQRDVARLEQQLASLNAQRRTLEAEGEALRPLLRVVDMHIMQTEAVLEFAQAASEDDTIDKVYEAYEQVTELFDLRRAESLRYLDQARSAAERQRRRAARWRRVRQILYGLGILTIVLGVVTDRLPLGWSLVVAALVWIGDQFIVQPWLARWEAGRRRDLLVQEIQATGRALVLTRVLEAELANTLRVVGLQPIRLVPMQRLRGWLDLEPL